MDDRFLEAVVNWGYLLSVNVTWMFRAHCTHVV